MMAATSQPSESMNFAKLFVPDKKEGAYVGRTIRMSFKDQNKALDILWEEHPVGGNPENYSYNSSGIGDQSEITFNSKQIEDDFIAILNRLKINYT